MNRLAKFDVTLNKNVRMNKTDYRAGEVVEVDDALLAELQLHEAVESFTEKAEKKTPRKAPAKKATDTPETKDGE